MADNTSSSGTKVDDKELADLMEELGLAEEDWDDVIYEDEGLAHEETPCWLVAAKVHTETGYSRSWFFANMRSAWGLAQDVKFRAIESYLYALELQKFPCIHRTL
jgi:hypothetical protein